VDEPQDKPLVSNAASSKQTRAAGKKAKRNAEWEREEIRTILSTRQGRKWFWRKMVAFKIFSQVFSDNPYKTAFNDGLRCAGLDLLHDVNAVGMLDQMQKEAAEDAERGV